MMCKMRYPMVSNFLTYKKVKHGTYLVRNHITTDEFLIQENVVNFMQHMDGKTDPKQICCAFSEKEKENIVDILDSYNLLRHTKVLLHEKANISITLYIPKRWATIEKIFASIYSLVIQYLSVPIFLLGMILGKTVSHDLNFTSAYLYSLFGIIIGIFFHETGHATVGISYGAKVFEMGVDFWGIFLKGAYVSMTYSHIKKRSKRALIEIAGIQVNFLLAGLLFLLSYTTSLTNLFYYMALANISLGLLNLMALKDLDGYKFVSTIFGDQNLKRRAKIILKRKSFRTKQFKRGVSGIITLIACCILYLQPLIIGIINITLLWEYI